MKHFSRITSSVLVCALIAAGCSNDSSSATGPAPSDTVTQTIAGNWIVSSFAERDEDKTSDFSGIMLSFSSTAAESGTVVATRDGSTITGTWRHSPAVTYYGASSTESIVLNLGSSLPFDQLSGTWNVESTTSTKMNLASPEIRQGEKLVLSRK
jgi:hypothetical protein